VRGLQMGRQSNTGLQYVNNVAITGFGIGLEFTEHLVAPNVGIGHCIAALYTPGALHANKGNFNLFRCASWLTVGSGPSYIDFDFDLEYSDGWETASTTAEISDPNNRAMGKLLVTQTNSPSGTPNNLVPLAILGGAHLNVSNTAGIAWRALTPLNSWAAYTTGTYGAVGYAKEIDGVVRCRGALSAGTKTAGTTLFTLPAGYRPAFQTLVGDVGQDARAMVEVDASGNVILSETTTATVLGLGAIQFPAEA